MKWGVKPHWPHLKSGGAPSSQPSPPMPPRQAPQLSACPAPTLPLVGLQLAMAISMCTFTPLMAFTATCTTMMRLSTSWQAWSRMVPVIPAVQWLPAAQQGHLVLQLREGAGAATTVGSPLPPLPSFKKSKEREQAPAPSSTCHLLMTKEAGPVARAVTVAAAAPMLIRRGRPPTACTQRPRAF